MNVSDKARETEFIGWEFLEWLWFRSERDSGVIDLGEKGFVEIAFEGKMTLESELEETESSISFTGRSPLPREARFALSQNRNITRTALRLTHGDEEYHFSIDSLWMNFNSLKTPKVLLDLKSDPEGLFYEKIGLIEKAVSLFDRVFNHYLELRLSSGWREGEQKELSDWIRKGKFQDTNS